MTFPISSANPHKLLLEASDECYWDMQVSIHSICFSHLYTQKKSPPEGRERLTIKHCNSGLNQKLIEIRQIDHRPQFPSVLGYQTQIGKQIWKKMINSFDGPLGVKIL